MLGKHLQGFLVGQIDAVITRSECQQTVQGAGVEKIPAELTREQRGNGSLPDPLGPSMVMTGTGLIMRRPPPEPHPGPLSQIQEMGNEVATFAQSWMRIGPLARSAATLNDMAIR